MNKPPARVSGTILFSQVALLLGACGGPVLSVDDAVILDDTLRLVAYVEREPVLGLRNSVEDCKVRFYIDGHEIDDDDTDEHGRASVKYKRPTGAEWFEARAVLSGQGLAAKGSIYRWDENRTIIAVDIDDTIADTKRKQLIFKDEDKSKPVHDSRKSLGRLAIDYHIVYLTARPRFLLEKTREWLREEKYPAGPVIPAPGLRQTARPGKFKRHMLDELRERWPNLLIGIGNNKGDAKAYGANEMLCLIIPPDDEEDDEFGHHAVVLDDWDAVAEVFVANRDVFSDPTTLSRAIRGREMLRLPLVKWNKH